jgi:serine/threonine protein kinase
MRQALAAGALDDRGAVEVAAQVLDALAHAHSRGVVHRDVKPSNVLLDRAGAAHLADFGLARLVDATRLTRADQVVGTAAYLAPEQVRGGPIGPAADVYALGLVLLECLTGYREYEGGEIEAAVARLHRAPHVPDDLPRDLARLIRRMTADDPRDRPTAGECAGLLAAGPLPDDGEHAPAGRSWGVALTAAALLGVVGTVGFAWSSTSDVSDPPPRATPSTTQRQVAPAVETVTVTVPVPTEAQPAVAPPAPAQAPDERAAAVVGPAEREAKAPKAPDPGKGHGPDKPKPGAAGKAKP